MSIKLLVAGDIHLGRRTSGLPEDIPPEVTSTSAAFSRLIDTALEEEVDLVCLTGDVVDQENKYFEALGPLRRGFNRLGGEDIPVYLVAGNHDYDVLPRLVEDMDREDVVLLGAGGTWESRVVPMTDSSLRLIGWSFPRQYVETNPIMDLDRGDSLDGVTLGLLHGTVGGSEDRYAPIGRSSLTGTPVDYWLLGHIHEPEDALGTDRYLYPGSPQPLDHSEKGPRGPWILEIEAGPSLETKHRAVAPVRFEGLTVDIESESEEAAWRSAVVERVDERTEELATDLGPVETLAYDLRMEGRTSAYEELSGWCRDDEALDLDLRVNTTSVRVHRVINAARPAVDNLEELAEDRTPVGLLARIVLKLETGEDEDFLEELLDRYEEKLGRMNAASVYQPLRSDHPMATSRPAAADRLKSQAYRLLYALIDQGS